MLKRLLEYFNLKLIIIFTYNVLPPKYFKYISAQYYINKLKNEHLLQDNKENEICKFNNSESCNCKCYNLNSTDNVK